MVRSCFLANAVVVRASIALRLCQAAVHEFLVVFGEDPARAAHRGHVPVDAALVLHAPPPQQ
eukprot:1796466-Rhodomonas_salina.1